eukprot:96121-Rhodomonas_salina.1
MGRDPPIHGHSRAAHHCNTLQSSHERDPGQAEGPARVHRGETHSHNFPLEDNSNPSPSPTPIPIPSRQGLPARKSQHPQVHQVAACGDRWGYRVPLARSALLL